MSGNEDKSVKMIEKLTPEQEEALTEYSRRWSRIGLSTDPIDFEKAKSCLVETYKLSGHAPPKWFVRLPSPFQGTVFSSFLCKLDENVEKLPRRAGKQVKKYIADEKWQTVAEMVCENVLNKKWKLSLDIKEQIINPLHGSHDASWLSVYEYFQYLGISEAEVLNPLIELAQCAGWCFTFDDLAIVTERPVSVTFDPEERLHNAETAAIRYSDNWGVFSWHGVQIPPHWILDKKNFTAAEALKCENIEQRQCGCDILGWDKILEEVGGKIVDEDPNPRIGTLIKAKIPDSGDELFLKVLCGTGRTFVIPVPRTMKTALEANAATYGWTTADFGGSVQKMREVLVELSDNRT